MDAVGENVRRYFSAGRIEQLERTGREHDGARVERLNWLADRSPRGLQQSAGLMVNYLYKLPEIDANHEAYTGDGRIAAASPIRALANA